MCTEHVDVFVFMKTDICFFLMLRNSTVDTKIKNSLTNWGT